MWSIYREMTESRIMKGNSATTLTKVAARNEHVPINTLRSPRPASFAFLCDVRGGRDRRAKISLVGGSRSDGKEENGIN